MDRIENRAEFSYIRYSNCWEDSEILCSAIEPDETKRVLSIASAGDNSLALVAHGAEVIAVDLNPAQIACLELRCLLIKKLDYQDCLAFLGIKPADNRLKIFDQLKGELNYQTKNFWESNRGAIEQGFIHTGKFEKYFHFFRKRILSLIHSKKCINELLREKSKEERIQYYENIWANRRWHWLFKIFFSKYVLGRMGRDPEFFRYVEVPVAENILSRSKYALTELETHKNPYLEYIVTGNYTHSLPFYLQENIYQKIRENLDKLIMFQGSFQEAAKKHGLKKFDGFNLSDIFEYLDMQTCTVIYKDLIKYAQTGARFVYWNMLVPRRCPKELADQVEYQEELSKKLFAQDKAFFYSDFIVEEKL